MSTNRGKSQEKILSDAQRFFSQENYTQALVCYQKLEPAEEVVEQIFHCKAKLLRRFWKQGKVDFFAGSITSFGLTDGLALALARMQGEQALKHLADQGQTLDATLAACSREKELKIALQSLRRLPSYKEMAEGWLCVLKSDPSSAANAFEMALEKRPYAAKAGKQVIDLAHSKTRFFDYFTADIEKLAEGLNQATLSSSLKGWLALRLGDKLWQGHPGGKAPWDKILSFWKQAAELNKNLEIDVAKRRMLTAGRRGSPLQFPQEWRALCKLLESKAPEHLQDFLEQLSGMPSTKLPLIPLCNFRVNPAGQFAKQNWLLTHPPTSFYLLYSRFAAMQLQCLEKCLLFPFDFSPEDLPYFFSVIRPKDAPWEEGYWNAWKTLCPILDQEYGQNPLYLQIRGNLARIQRDFIQMRRTYYRRIRQDPEKKEELLPYYMEAFSLSLKKEGCLKERLEQADWKPELLEELTQLVLCFPNDYDFIRLFLVSSYTKEEICQQAAYYMMNLSPPDQQLLRCQLMQDYGSSKETLLLFLPRWEEIRSTKEGKERFLQLVMTPALAQDRCFQPAVEELTMQELHAILKRLEKRSEIQLHPSLFDALKSKWEDHPYVTYHKGLQELAGLTSHENLPKVLQELDAVVGKLDKNDPARERLCATIQLFSVCYGIRIMLADQAAKRTKS